MSDKHGACWVCIMRAVVCADGNDCDGSYDVCFGGMFQHVAGFPQGEEGIEVFGPAACVLMLLHGDRLPWGRGETGPCVAIALIFSLCHAVVCIVGMSCIPLRQLVWFL